MPIDETMTTSGEPSPGAEGAAAPEPSRPESSRLASFVALVRSVAEVDATAVESAARRLGESRRWLAPLAWAAGTLVLLFNGIKLLVVNWRLLLLQIVPASWIWLATWDLKRHLLHGAELRHVGIPAVIAISIAILAITVVAFWCNLVFALALDGPPPPRIAPAIRASRESRGTTARWGLAVGAALVVATIIIPRTGRIWLFSLILTTVIVVMTITFVALPARILGIKRKKLPPKEAISRAAAGGALSAVAMGPGFVMGRIGLLLLGIPGVHVFGFLLLSVGSALYAAGMSSVKVVTLSMKLTTGDEGEPRGSVSSGDAPSANG